MLSIKLAESEVNRVHVGLVIQSVKWYELKVLRNARLHV